MAIYEVAYVDGNRMSSNEGSTGLAVMRTRFGGGECDSRGHRLRVLSKGEAGDVRVLLQDKLGCSTPPSLSRVIGCARISDSSELFVPSPMSFQHAPVTKGCLVERIVVFPI